MDTGDFGTLVAGRECGDCTVCCTVPAIDDSQIQKKSATTCRHCTQAKGGGCGVYDTRLTICRTFHCAWRYLPDMDDRWRPDKSGVFAALDKPDPGALPPITLMLIGNPLRTLRETWFIDFVRKCALKSRPVFLSLPGPAGYRPLRALMTPQVLVQAARACGSGVKAFLEEALKFLRSQPFPEQVLKHSGNDVSA